MNKLIAALCLVALFSGAQAGIRTMVFGSRCVPVPTNACALAYDDEDCGGWKLEIPEGEMLFKMWNPFMFRYRNDIETVSVRAGCMLTGFEDSSLNGKSVTVLATGGKDKTVNIEDLDDDMDENIESVRCTCN